MTASSDGSDTEPGAPARASRAGQIVADKYRIIRLLGEGGMGAVYEARHEVVGRRFAVKFLHPELATNTQILARFRREARAAGAIENENIAAVTDFGSAADGAPFIVMEYLEGEDFARLLTRTGPLAVSRAVHAVIQACRGLGAAHSAGIVHRDLKPENLFVSRRGDGSDLVKVLDFGIAKLKVVESESASTRTGTTMGTAYYMPPEQARGQKDIDERADIYALGVILYELLSGQRPHVGDTYNAVLYHILTQPAARLETLRRGLPLGLADLVHRAMAFEPADRFASVHDLVSALAPFAGRELTPVDSTAPTSRVPEAAVTRLTPISGVDLPIAQGAPAAQVSVQPTVAGTSVSQGDTEAPSSLGRAPWLVAVAVLGLGAGAFAVWGRSDVSPAPEAASASAVATSEISAPAVSVIPPAPTASAEPVLSASNAPALSASAPPALETTARAPQVRKAAMPKPTTATPPSPPAARAPPAPQDDNDLYKP